MDDFRKAFETTIDDIDPKNREVVAIISTDSVDREKDVLLPKGLRRKNYAGMTIDYNHDKNLPIGVSKWVKAEPHRVISKYRVSDKTDFSRDVFNLLQDGVLRYHSVDGKCYAASKPTSDEVRINKTWDGARIIRDWEMYNFTVCTVPQNEDAVALMVAKGYNPKTIETIIGKPINQDIPPTAQPATIISSARLLTSGEACIALSKALAARMHGVSIDSAIAKALSRAAGRID
jgi:phage head maturation protease